MRIDLARLWGSAELPVLRHSTRELIAINIENTGWREREFGKTM
jgi:hypothetical protein